MLGGAAVAVAGVVLMLQERWAVGVPLGLVGIAIELSGAWVHDLGHRRRGEVPHAMWGEADRNRPSWWPRRRGRAPRG
jgi:hypothetical protein